MAKKSKYKQQLDSISDREFSQNVKTSSTFHDLYVHCGFPSYIHKNSKRTTLLFRGKPYRLCMDRIHRMGLNYSHLKIHRKILPREKLKNKRRTNTVLHKILDSSGRLSICEICRCEKMQLQDGIWYWNQKPLKLQIDHINGMKCDDCDSAWNLRRLCGNCHSQTHNYRTFKHGLSKHANKSRRERMLKNGIQYICACCKCKDMKRENEQWLWHDWPLKLEVDHIDGNHKNDTLSNLRFVCNSCHTQTDTFCGRHSKIGKKGKKRITHRTVV